MELDTSTEEIEQVAQAPSLDGVTPDQFKRLGLYIMQGMNEHEAAILAGIDKVTIMMMKRSTALYNDFVEKKKLEFKRKHLKIISQKSDPKISQWLLERLSPEEFNSKGKKTETPTNVVAAIIKDIQNDSATSTLAFAYHNHELTDDGSITQRTSRDEAEQRIRDVLK